MPPHSDLKRHPLEDPAWYRQLNRVIRQEIKRVARPVRGIVGVMTNLGAQFFGRAGEVMPDVEVAQHFGFASVMPPGTEVVTVSIGGAPGHRVIVGEIDRTYRPTTTLLMGESAIYAQSGAQVTCKADGSVEVASVSGTKVTVTAAGQVLLDGGGAAVARVGDTVAISGVDSTGGPFSATGTITSGSTTVQAGG